MQKQQNNKIEFSDSQLWDKFKGTRKLAGKTAGQYEDRIIPMPTFFLGGLTPASNQVPQLLTHCPWVGWGKESEDKSGKNHGLR